MGRNDFSAVDLLFSDRLLEYSDAERSARTALTLGRLPEEDGIWSTDHSRGQTLSNFPVGSTFPGEAELPRGFSKRCIQKWSNND